MADILTAVSILVAAITWLMTRLNERSDRRVAHTATVIASLSTSERLGASSAEVTRLINSGRPVTAEIDPKTESHVIDILDYYEFVTALCAGGVVDKDTITLLRGRLMQRTWAICEPYIMHTRTVQARDVYAGFERFVKNIEFKD